ncbi:MAG: hydrogenase maturation protease [Actinomycetota bacterium]
MMEIGRTARVFVGGVGNPWRRDLDFGPMFVRRVAEIEWPPDVVVEDAAVSAHRVLHRLQELQPRRVVFVSGFPRGDPPGTVRRYVVEGPLPDEEEIKDRMGESAGGVIDFDHTIIINRYFKTLPDDTVVIEVEAVDTSFGTGFSAEVEASIDRVLQMVREEIAR